MKKRCCFTLLTPLASFFSDKWVHMSLKTTWNKEIAWNVIRSKTAVTAPRCYRFKFWSQSSISTLNTSTTHPAWGGLAQCTFLCEVSAPWCRHRWSKWSWHPAEFRMTQCQSLPSEAHNARPGGIHTKAKPLIIWQKATDYVQCSVTHVLLDTSNCPRR